MPDIKELQVKMNYTFRNEALLVHALAPVSYTHLLAVSCPGSKFKVIL